MAIRIYTPEGQTPFTRRVRLQNVETHIAARDRHASEAEMLREFAESSDVPKTLCGGAWRRHSEGADELGDYVRYVEATT